MQNEGLSPVVIACWPDATMLDGIDASTRPKAVVVLPWGSEQEIESWRVARAVRSVPVGDAREVGASGLAGLPPGADAIGGRPPRAGAAK